MSKKQPKERSYKVQGVCVPLELNATLEPIAKQYHTTVGNLIVLLIEKQIKSVQSKEDLISIIFS